MDSSFVEYYKIFLDIAVAVTISSILLLLVRRNKKEKTLIGYRVRPRNEKFAGYSLLIIGAVLTAFSALQLIVLSTSDFYSETPLGLSAIQLSSNSQTTDLVSAQLLGLVFGTSFWLLILVCGGAKLVTLGFDLLRGTQVRIVKKIRFESRPL